MLTIRCEPSTSALITVDAPFSAKKLAEQLQKEAGEKKAAGIIIEKFQLMAFEKKILCFYFVASNCINLFLMLLLFFDLFIYLLLFTAEKFCSQEEYKNELKQAIISVSLCGQ